MANKKQQGNREKEGQKGNQQGGRKAVNQAAVSVIKRNPEIGNPAATL